MIAQIVSTVIFVFGTCIAVFVAIYVTDIIKQKLPMHTRLALEQFARMAVQKVELNNPSMGMDAKKQLAMLDVSTLFHSFSLPLPNQDVISIAVDAEMYKTNE